jgi:hypothetical protein
MSAVYVISRDASGLHPAPERLRQRGETTLRANRDGYCIAKLLIRTARRGGLFVQRRVALGKLETDTDYAPLVLSMRPDVRPRSRRIH